MARLRGRIPPPGRGRSRAKRAGGGREGNTPHPTDFAVLVSRPLPSGEVGGDCRASQPNAPVFRFVLLAGAIAALAVIAAHADAAWAQAGPFGAPRSQAPAAPAGGVLGWIFAKQ